MTLSDNTRQFIKEYESEEGITVFVDDENLSPEDLEGEYNGKQAD